MLNDNQSYNNYHKKKIVHTCELPKQENINIEEYYPNSCRLTRKILLLCLITTNVSRREIYSKSHKELEKERRIHLRDYKYIIHPFSDFAYYWEVLMIIVFLIQLFFTPKFIVLTSNFKPNVYFILITQIMSCLNILVSCFTGHYRTDIKEVILNQKDIFLNLLKTGYFMTDLIGSLPLSFISYMCGAPIITQSLLACFIPLNIFALLKYLKIFRQKRGYSFMIFNLLNAYIVFIFGVSWLTVLIYVGVHLDSTVGNINIKQWRWFYNTYNLIFGKEISFRFIGYEFFFSTIALIFGIFIRYFIIAHVIVMCKTFYSSERKRSRLFTELNEFCHYKRLPYNLTKRLVQYYELKFHNVYYNESQIMDQLSENLRNNIKDYRSKAWFEADIFKLCPLPLRQLITFHLEEEIYFKNDFIYQIGNAYTHIYFIKSGSILWINKDRNKMYVVPEGNFFSEKALLPVTAPHTSTVIAIESCQIFKLSRENFLKIIKSFPSEYTTIIDILESRKRYLYKGMRLKSQLRLDDYYHIARRYTGIE